MEQPRENTGVVEQHYDDTEIIEQHIDKKQRANDQNNTDLTTDNDRFNEAMEQGFQLALEGGERPQRKRKGEQDAMYEYINLIFGDMEPEVAFTLLAGPDANNIMTLLTQMSAKKGLKYFGKSGADAIVQELEQLIYCKVMEGKK